MSELSETPLKYPAFPDQLTRRMHFQAAGSLRRERSLALARHAQFFSIQEATNGDVLASVGVGTADVRTFERLVESVGPESMRATSGRKGGFASGWSRDGINENSTWHRMVADNQQARLYHWTAQKVAFAVPLELPGDLPRIPESLPWDPDPRFQAILRLTEEGRVEEAACLLDAIAPHERTVLFDEVLYLRYVTGRPPRGTDLIYIAKGYIANSSLHARLHEEFDEFLQLLDLESERSGPLPPEFPGLEKLGSPSAEGWLATRAKYFRELADFGHPTQPRGRLFVWHPDITAYSMQWVRNAFRPQLVAAENAFRRLRSLPEIGKGWASEVALFSIVGQLHPDAVHQWHPSFLGAQSVDIYIPSLNLAIEYQGKQHYEPVGIFGGMEGFLATCARDERKRLILKERGVGLLEWRYDRPVTMAELSSALPRCK